MTDKEILQSLCEILISNDRDRWCELVENGTKEQQKDFLFNKEKHCFSALFDKYISLQEKLNTVVKDIKWIYSGNCSINDCPLYKSGGPTVCVWQDGSGNMNWCKNKQKCKYCNKPRV